MTLKLNIRSAVDLIRLTPQELEGQANILLYGHPYVLDEACDREVIRRLYIPRNLNKPIVYREPKKWACFDRVEKRRVECRCVECGRPRHYGSGQRCLFCFTVGVRTKFYDAVDGHDWLERQAKGIVMPETEWWDDSDLPAQPKRLVPIGWNVDRLDFSRLGRSALDKRGA